MAPSCVMGCQLTGKSQKLHYFPKDPKRRAEWCRILGVYPRNKHIYICSAHFSDGNFFGNRLTIFAVPNPPESKISNARVMPMSNTKHERDSNCDADEKSIYGDQLESDSLETDPLELNDVLQQENIKNKSEETVGKVEDFEIRRGITNSMIIKGRFVQTNDYIVVSYTPPRKWSLQEQVKILDGKCTQQLRQIKQLVSTNQKLFNELQMQKNLLARFRKLQSHDRLLYTKLQKYRNKEKERRKRAKKERLKKLQTDA